ncbi:hypothetical protein B0J14DRAFT_555699 [Halenospora varia]|nr:hypothetical protein B0J14DRAFT_555699 [Halenospora varia]
MVSLEKSDEEGGPINFHLFSKPPQEMQAAILHHTFEPRILRLRRILPPSKNMVYPLALPDNDPLVTSNYNITILSPYKQPLGLSISRTEVLLCYQQVFDSMTGPRALLFHPQLDTLALSHWENMTWPNGTTFSSRLLMPTIFSIYKIFLQSHLEDLKDVENIVVQNAEWHFDGLGI